MSPHPVSNRPVYGPVCGRPQQPRHPGCIRPCCLHTLGPLLLWQQRDCTAALLAAGGLLHDSPTAAVAGLRATHNTETLFYCGFPGCLFMCAWQCNRWLHGLKGLDSFWVERGCTVWGFGGGGGGAILIAAWMVSWMVGVLRPVGWVGFGAAKAFAARMWPTQSGCTFEDGGGGVLLCGLWSLSALFVCGLWSLERLNTRRGLQASTPCC